MTCPNCGRQLPDGSVYCLNCGARFRYAATTATQVREEMEAKRATRRRRCRIALIIAIPAIALAAAVFLLYILVLSPSARYDNSMEAASNYSLTGAYESAAESYAAAVERQPESVEAHAGLAESLSHCQRWEEAAAEYIELGRLAPGYEGISSGLMAAYMGMEEWELAYALVRDGIFGQNEPGYSAIVRSLTASCLESVGFEADYMDMAVLAAQLLGRATAGEWSVRDGALFISVDRGGEAGVSRYSFTTEPSCRIYADAASWLDDAGSVSDDWSDILDVSYDAGFARLMLDSYTSHLRGLGVLSSVLTADIDDDGAEETVFIVSDFRANWRAQVSYDGEAPSADPLQAERNSGLTAIVADVSGGRIHFRPVCITADAEIATDSLIEQGRLYILTRQYIYACTYADADNTADMPSLSVERRDNTGSLYLMRYAVGDAAACDLDGDGGDETVALALEGKKTLLTLDGALWEDVDGLLTGAAKDWYYLADIDTSDERMELAVVTGSGSSAVTHFFAAGDSGLKHIGSVAGRPGSDDFELDGRGELRSHKILSILQSWSAPCIWRLNDSGALEEQVQELWYPNESGSGSTVTVKKAFPSFASNDLLSDTVRVREGSKLTFTGTDNQFWISFRTDRDVEGWIYLPDGQSVLTGEETVSAASLFNGLNT